MNERFDELLEKISQQQKDKEFTDIFMVGEQLKDICRNNSHATELVLSDLDVPEMSLEKCAGEIKKEADRLHREKRGKCICIPPDMAEGIIRKFYGIPEDSAECRTQSAEQSSDNIIRLEDFI